MSISSHEYSANYIRLQRLKLQYAHEEKRLKDMADFLNELALLRTHHRVVIADTRLLADHMYYAGAVTANERRELAAAHRHNAQVIKDLEASLTEAFPSTQSPSENTHP